MKKWAKSALSVLLTILSVLLITGSLSRNTFAASNDTPSNETLPTGYIPVEKEGGRALTNAYLNGDSKEYRKMTPNQVNTPLPARYDSRDYGYITAVRNQNPYGTCWTFGTMAPIEAYMIKHGVIDKDTGAAASADIDLSEYHLAWFTYSDAYDADGMLAGEKSAAVGDTFLDVGGNNRIATMTLMRWEGAASEKTPALAYSNASVSGLDAEYAYAYNNMHLLESVWIPSANQEAVKRAIMEYGAGTISYCHEDQYYNPYTYAFYNPDAEWTNHAVTIVGWDDNFAVSNFAEGCQPKNPGAWIIKNSWGTWWGDNGYFYLSYEDLASLQDECSFFKADAESHYDHNYQYDGTLDVMHAISLPLNSKIANVFTASGAQVLEAVAVNTWDEAVSYQLDVYKNLTDQRNPESGTLVSSQTGYFPFYGYLNVPLETPVILEEDDTFSVVFTLSIPEDPSQSSTRVSVPYDTSSSGGFYTAEHVDHGNTSFCNFGYGSWSDCPGNGDFRIKAYTSDIDYQITAEVNDSAYGTVSVSGSVITAVPEEGYYVADVEVVSGTATCTINGNTIKVKTLADCTIRIIFAVKPAFTVNFYDRGQIVNQQQALIYDVITLPYEGGNVSSNWSFIGWITAELQETNTPPEFLAPGSDYLVTQNTDFYALYSLITGETEIAYQIVNEEPTDWSGRYVITTGKDSNLTAMKGVESERNLETPYADGAVPFAGTGMRLEGKLLKDVSDDYVFTISRKGSIYTIQSPTGYWIGTRSDYLYNLSEYQQEYADWDIHYDTYHICMEVSNTASVGFPYLTSSDGNFFMIGGEYTTAKLQFWKEFATDVICYSTSPDDSLNLSILHSISLRENLSINYYIPAASLEGYENIRLHAERNKYQKGSSEFTVEQYEITDGELRTVKGTLYFRFTFKNIAAKEIGDDVRVTVLADKNGKTYESAVDTYSIKTYAMQQLANENCEEKLQTLLVDLLNYGVAAQTYFEYRTDMPANRDLTDEQLAKGTQDIGELTSVYSFEETDAATAGFVGKSLLLGNEIGIKYYMDLSNVPVKDNIRAEFTYITATGIESLAVFRFDEFEYNQSQNAYVVRLKTIAAKDAGQPVEARIIDGDTLISGVLTYSIESYAKSTLEDSSDERLRAVVTEMMKYCKSAEAYLVQ